MDWDPSLYLYPPSSHVKERSPFVLLILNQKFHPKLFHTLHTNALFTICADGAANCLHDMLMTDMKDLDHAKACDLILGDLDSLKSSVRTYFQNFGVQVIQDHDQDSTDFTKCLWYIRDHKDAILRTSNRKHAPADTVSDRLDVVVLGGMGGRLDQAISTIHHLYFAARDPTLIPGNLFLVTAQNISFVLKKGKNAISTPLKEGILLRDVGVLPVGVPAIITTKGLEWDVKDWKTELGGVISTSNHIKSDVIEIETNEPVLFTVEFAPSVSGEAKL
ncbi:MAG: hypothetical protein M1834_009191 [Cirrosporium novae-zelandiae]|nr:MAG: hypothetical protein M1834_009191 [Cirrosporium novae-zelandiae]